MAHLGTLRDFRFEDQTDDIRDATLYGRDSEKLGKIKDVIFDHSTGAVRYAVVDTGGWLSSKLFLVPADRIRARGDKDDEYSCSLSKDQIKNFPAYDEKHLDNENRWKDYEQSYRGAAKFEETGGVLHVAGGTNVLVSDGLRAEGPAPTTQSGQPISGYKSPIHHRVAGPMDTTPLGVGRNQDDQDLKFVPDAVAGDRGSVRDKEISAETGNANVTSTREPASAAPCASAGQKVPHRYDDRVDYKKGSPVPAVEETIVGDSIFNSEDRAEQVNQPGNVHATDKPSYATVSGTENQTMSGRLPNYPDASQGQRWARFEENLRRQRPKIVGRCSVCEEFENRHHEDVA